MCRSEISFPRPDAGSPLHEVHQRYAGRRGRYNKHDTARLRFIKDTAFPGVRFGKKVQERDMAMLRLPPTSELGGAALAEMDESSRRHAPDPRSSNQGEVARLDEEQQSTLLRWTGSAMGPRPQMSSRQSRSLAMRGRLS